jgi:hypothetical protein
MVPSQEDEGAVVEQLKQLRRNYKNLKVLLIVLWLLVILFLSKLLLSQSPQIVTAEGFLMQDAKGTARAYWGFIGGDPFFYMNDAKGKSQVVLSADPSGPSLILYHGEPSKARARLSTGAAGTSLSLVDASGKPRVVLKYVEEKPEERKQEAALIFYDKDGHVIFTAP